MSEFVIKASSGYVPVPVTDIGTENLDFNSVSFVSADIESGGTLQDPKKIWEGNGGHIYSYGSANNVTLLVQSMSNSTEPFSGNIGPASSTQYVFMCGVQRLINDVPWLYCYFVYADDESAAKTQLNRFAGEGTVLYAGLLENSQDMLDVERAWDDTPAEEGSTDINRMLPEGGEFADREEYNITDDNLFSELEYKEENYGSLIKCVYVPQSQLNILGDALFVNNFWQSLKAKFEGLSDPLSFILSCVELPFTPSTAAGGEQLKLGGEMLLSSQSQPVVVYRQSSRYHVFTMATMTLKETWGTAKDYTDCTIEIYLPYVGMRQIDADLAINSELTLKASVDVWTGDILYLLQISTHNMANRYVDVTHITYRWSGNCAKKIPLGRVDTSNQIMSLLGAVTRTATGYAAGGAIGAVLAGGSDLLNANYNPTVQTSGSVAGAVGCMDLPYPYLVIKRGVPEYPNNWRSEIGAPRYQEFKLSNLIGTGYTLFNYIELGDMGNATEEEKSELERLLTTEGVIL